MAVEEPVYRYFLAREPGLPPRWIGWAQWLLFAAWLAFGHWILFGQGLRSLERAYYGFHGLYAPEVAYRASVFPNFLLVTLALGALCVWLQALWIRCRWTVREEGGTWVWTGRGGPGRVLRLTPTPGGAWVRGERRWFYVPRGLVSGPGREWLAKVGEGIPRGLTPLTLASPLFVLLLALVGGAWVAQAPVRSYHEARRSVMSAVWSGDSVKTERALQAHPEFRPWARYVSSLAASDRAEGLGRVIRDRLEVFSMGPSYGGDSATLARLLILSGRSGLLLKLSGEKGPAAFEVAVRSGDVREARRILAAVPRLEARRGTLLNAMLLLQEGRAEEAYQQAERSGEVDTARGIALGGVLAALTGRCEESAALARALLRPEALTRARLDGPASAQGLGTLQRAAQKIVERSATAVGLELLDDGIGARAAWREAENLASEAGLPGLLQVDAVFLSALDPAGPWSSGRGLVPRARATGSSGRGIIHSEVQR